MDLLATLFLTLHVANPFAAPIAQFHIVPAKCQITCQQGIVSAGVSVRVSGKSGEGFDSRPSNVPEQQPAPPLPADNPIPPPTGCPYGDAIPIDSAKCIPPGGWTADNAPGFGATCWTTTQCLNEAFGTPAGWSQDSRPEDQ